MAPPRHHRSRQQRLLEAVHEQPESTLDAQAPNSNHSHGLATSASGNESVHDRTPRPTARTASVVGVGRDIIFAPVGSVSIPRIIHNPDTRPIDWMFTSFDELKPLSIIREELLQAAASIRDTERQAFKANSVRLGLGGRRLFLGESPPF